MHIISVVSGFVGVFAFGVAIVGGENNLFGITKADVLLCAGILILVAIWVQIAAIHHIMLEKTGEVI